MPGGVQGYDRYAYVNNNPVNGTDPSGHYACGDGEVHNCNGGLSNPRAIDYNGYCNNSTSKNCGGIDGDSSDIIATHGKGGYTKSGTGGEAVSDPISNFNHVGLGFVTPEFTFGVAESPLYKFEFYYRFGITIGGDSIVFSPFNKGVSLPNVYYEDGEYGITSGIYESGNTSLQQDVGIKSEDWTITLNVDQVSKTEMRFISIYHYGGMKFLTDTKPLAAASAIFAVSQAPQLYNQLIESFSRTPVLVP